MIHFFPPSRKSVSAISQHQQRQPGFSYLELVVAAAISVIVLGSLGAVALISELRLGRDAEVSQSLRDSWGRTLAFIASETQHAYWIRTSLASGETYPCSGMTAPSGPLLVLYGPPNPTASDPTNPSWRVVYGVRENGDSTQWRGLNRLVRCGPPFEEISRENLPESQRAAALKAAAMGGNLSFTTASTETVIADQLAEDRQIDCPPQPQGTTIVGTCRQPFQARIFDTTAGRDRDAQLSLYMGRRTGGVYPPPATFPGFHTQIRANRNPGFEITGNPNCATTLDAVSGNNKPPSGAACRVTLTDVVNRSYSLQEYNLPASGNLVINRCGVSGDDCNGPETTELIDVIFVKGNYADYTKQYSQADSTRPCSRKSCFLSKQGQNIQIYDGNMLIFYDRIIRI